MAETRKIEWDLPSQAWTELVFSGVLDAAANPTGKTRGKSGGRHGPSHPVRWAIRFVMSDPNPPYSPEFGRGAKNLYPGCHVEGR